MRNDALLLIVAYLSLAEMWAAVFLDPPPLLVALVVLPINGLATGVVLVITLDFIGRKNG